MKYSIIINWIENDFYSLSFLARTIGEDGNYINQGHDTFSGLTLDECIIKQNELIKHYGN
jgi:hypothetical protein